MESEGKKRTFWTFVITKRTVEVRGEEPTIFPVAVVEGQFVYVIHQALKREEIIIPIPLTPPDKKVTLEIPGWMFPNKTVEEITAKDILDRLIELINEPFEVVQPPPPEIPWHKVPPSKRPKLRKAAEKKRRKESLSVSPEVTEEDE